MSLVSRIWGGVFGAGTVARHGQSDSISDQQGWFVRMIGGGKTKAGVAVNEHLARNMPVVYACVNRISNPIASFPVRIYRSKPGGGSEIVEDHPLSRRLGARPNDHMSSRTFRKALQGHALLWGNGYAEIERNTRGQAVNLWPLLPDRTGPRAKDGDFWFETNIGGQTHRLDQGDVIHIMDQSHDGYCGISPIQKARQALGLAFAMEEFGAKFFANDAKSGGFLMHPGKLTSRAHSNIRGKDGERKAAPENPASILEKQGGLENANRVKVLEEGMKFIPTTVSQEDSQFLGSREFQIAEFARIYDVPLVLLQSHEKTTSWGSGIEQLMIGFVTSTIEPWVRAWEQELNWKLFTHEERSAGLYVKFNMNALLRGDMTARAAFYEAMFRMAGLSINQLLALEDMDPIGADGDERFVSANLVALKNALNPPETPATPANSNANQDDAA